MKKSTKELLKRFDKFISQRISPAILAGAIAFNISLTMVSLLKTTRAINHNLVELSKAQSAWNNEDSLENYNERTTITALSNPNDWEDAVHTSIWFGIGVGWYVFITKKDKEV